MKYNLIFIARVRRSTVDKSDRVAIASKCMALILVVEDTAEQRPRIAGIDSVPTRMHGHFGVNRTYDTIASKYYCIIQCETTCKYKHFSI